MDAELLRNYIEAGFGGVTNPEKYSIENKYDVFIIEAKNSPYEDFNSFSSFGLSKYQLKGVNGLMPFRVEILSGSVAGVENYSRVVVSAVTYFIDSGTCYAPGSLILNGTEKSRIKYGDLPHLYLTTPMYWKHDFGGIGLSQYDVKFLCVFPISEKELLFCKKYGSEKFEELLEREEADIFNIGRPSIL